MAIQRFSPVVGGGELQLERLLPRLHARGVHASVLTRAVPGLPRHDVVAATSVFRTPLAGESALASAVYVTTSLMHILRRWRTTDVVHAHGMLSPATIALAARLVGKPCLVTPLGAGPPGDIARLRRKPVGARRLAMLVRRARFVALSAEIAQELHAAGVPKANVCLIPNGVDFEEYMPASAPERERLRSELGLDSDRFYGVFVGRLHPVKGADTLLRALEKTEGIDLLIVGDGPERDVLRGLASTLGIEDRVRFEGSSSRVSTYLKAADAFFLPSLGEGMPNAVLEAMACGLPCVVTTAVGGVEELLGPNGLTVAPRDVSGWADAMQRLAGDAEGRRRLGGAARDRVRATYAIEDTSDRLASLYRELVTRA